MEDVVGQLRVRRMAVSKHLKVVEGAGLIERERDGRVHRCSFDPTTMVEAKDWIEKHRRFWTQPEHNAFR